MDGGGKVHDEKAWHHSVLAVEVIFVNDNEIHPMRYVHRT